MILYLSVKRHGHLAQLVESLLDVQVVSGSIPLVSTNKHPEAKALGCFLFIFPLTHSLKGTDRKICQCLFIRILSL